MPSFDDALLPKENAADSLVIALDFGTTFSGIAYSFSTDAEKIYTITNWPGGEERIVPKTPTVMQYDSQSKNSFKWGYELEMSTGEKITALKLLFDPDQKRPYRILNDTGAEKAKLPKPVVDVAADYMRAIFNHALEEIKADSVDPGFVDFFDKKFILTVPAVWSDKAKDMTLRAARNAGISPVEMITEPEAAALCTLHSMKSKGLEVGDAVVICDAGGGTVDLVSYEIQSLDPFKLRALTAPSGGVCGSLMINELFEEEVCMKIGYEAFSELQKTDAYQSGLRDFDTAIKPAFRGPEDRDRYVSFPMAGLEDNPSGGLVSNTMTLSGKTLEAIFEPVVNEIDSLVTEQVAELREELMRLYEKGDPKAIFLVGGFGSSAYLKSVISESNPGVLVIQPKEAWSAIVRGAAMSRLGIAPIVTASKATKHYGIRCNSHWDDFRDQGRRAYKDEWSEELRCVRMWWYIYKNDSLARDEKIRFPFSYDIGEWEFNNGVLDYSCTLQECRSLLAPKHPDESIRTNSVLRADLSRVPEKYFTWRKRPSDQALYVNLKFHLVIENNPSGLMRFSIAVDGKEYATVDAMY